RLGERLRNDLRADEVGAEPGDPGFIDRAPDEVGGKRAAALRQRTSDDVPRMEDAVVTPRVARRPAVEAAQAPGRRGAQAEHRQAVFRNGAPEVGAERADELAEAGVMVGGVVLGRDA